LLRILRVSLVAVSLLLSGFWSLDMEFLWSKLDFEIGMHFEKNLQRSTGRCIHDSVGNDSGFHLLATFR
jgi:hypothetical protein